MKFKRMKTKTCSYSDQNSVEYRRFIESMVEFCHCVPLERRPCDGVLAGGVCDGAGQEPDFTLDDLEWIEEYE